MKEFFAYYNCEIIPELIGKTQAQKAIILNKYTPITGSYDMVTAMKLRVGNDKLMRCAVIKWSITVTDSLEVWHSPFIIQTGDISISLREYKNNYIDGET